MSDTQEFSESGAPIYRHQAKPRKIEHAAGNVENLEKLSKHVERYIGKIDRVFHEIVSDLVHVDVHHIAPTPERNYHTLVTSGMSDRPMRTPKGAESFRYAELMLCLPPEWPISEAAFEDERNYWPVRWLKVLARFPHEFKTWLFWGHTIPNGDPPRPFAPDTDLCCMLLLEPRLAPVEFKKLRMSDSKTVYFLALIPLYKEEMDLKLAQGTDELEVRFSEHAISELFDIRRPNLGK
jgi:hypothetical protein